MPKSIIREFDNSTSGIALSSEFAVVVPGYLSAAKAAFEQENIQAAVDAGVYVDVNYIYDPETGARTIDPTVGCYQLASQSQFDKFIGKDAGKEEPAVAPTLQVLNPDSTGLDKYRKRLTSQEIQESASVSEWKYYRIEAVLPGSTDYGKNGHLLRTFSAEEIGSAEVASTTFRFVAVSQLDMLNDYIADTGATAHFYARINIGDEGTDFVAETHIGNQIAYELLGLGYTVLYKRISRDSGATDQLSSPLFWERLKNKSVYRFRYLMSGGCYEPEVMKQMVNIAEFYKLGEDKISIEDADSYVNGTEGVPNGRGDVIALCDINESGINPATTQTLLTTTAAAIGAIGTNSKYAAIFGPRVAYAMSSKATEKFGGNNIFPASFNYLACAASAQARFAEWYAVAGYNRGSSPYKIAYTTLTYGEIAINTLSPRVPNMFVAANSPAVNLILSERGSFYIWGNRTAAPITSEGLKFSHFLNIRQLCCTIKKVLWQATRQFTFNPNSDLLWISFVNAIKPTLDTMKADQGIKGYRISRVATDKKGLLVAKVRIVPIEAVEDFDISISLEDSLAGIVVSADESEAVTE